LETVTMKMMLMKKVVITITIIYSRVY